MVRLRASFQADALDDFFFFVRERKFNFFLVGEDGVGRIIYHFED